MSETETQLHARRILLVEDDRFLRKAAQTALTRHGFHVETASDGEEALRLVGAEKPELILLDLIMPKIQGFEVLRALKADPETASIPVIVLSNLGQDRDLEVTREAGAAAHLVKANMSLDEVVAAVERVLAETA